MTATTNPSRNGKPKRYARPDDDRGFVRAMSEKNDEWAMGRLGRQSLEDQLRNHALVYADHLADAGEPDVLHEHVRQSGRVGDVALGSLWLDEHPEGKWVLMGSTPRGVIHLAGPYGITHRMRLDGQVVRPVFTLSMAQNDIPAYLRSLSDAGVTIHQDARDAYSLDRPVREQRNGHARRRYAASDAPPTDEQVLLRHIADHSDPWHGPHAGRPPGDLQASVGAYADEIEARGRPHTAALIRRFAVWPEPGREWAVRALPGTISHPTYHWHGPEPGEGRRVPLQWLSVEHPVDDGSVIFGGDVPSGEIDGLLERLASEGHYPNLFSGPSEAAMARIQRHRKMADEYHRSRMSRAGAPRRYAIGFKNIKALAQAAARDPHLMAWLEAEYPDIAAQVKGDTSATPKPRLPKPAPAESPIHSIDDEPTPPSRPRPSAPDSGDWGHAAGQSFPAESEPWPHGETRADRPPLSHRIVGHIVNGVRGIGRLIERDKDKPRGEDFATRAGRVIGGAAHAYVNWWNRVAPKVESFLTGEAHGKGDKGNTTKAAKAAKSPLYHHVLDYGRGVIQAAHLPSDFVFTDAGQRFLDQARADKHHVALLPHADGTQSAWISRDPALANRLRGLHSWLTEQTQGNKMKAGLTRMRALALFGNDQPGVANKGSTLNRYVGTAYDVRSGHVPLTPQGAGVPLHETSATPDGRRLRLRRGQRPRRYARWHPLHSAPLITLHGHASEPRLNVDEMSADDAAMMRSALGNHTDPTTLGVAADYFEEQDHPAGRVLRDAYQDALRGDHEGNAPHYLAHRIHREESIGRRYHPDVHAAMVESARRVIADPGDAAAWDAHDRTRERFGHQPSVSWTGHTTMPLVLRGMNLIREFVRHSLAGPPVSPISGRGYDRQPFPFVRRGLMADVWDSIPREHKREVRGFTHRPGEISASPEAVAAAEEIAPLAGYLAAVQGRSEPRRRSRDGRPRRYAAVHDNSVHPDFAGTRVGRALQHLASRVYPDHPLYNRLPEHVLHDNYAADLAEEMLYLGPRHEQLIALGDHLKAIGHPLGEAYRWERVAPGLALDKKVREAFDRHVGHRIDDVRNHYRQYWATTDPSMDRQSAEQYGQWAAFAALAQHHGHGSYAPVLPDSLRDPVFHAGEHVASELANEGYTQRDVALSFRRLANNAGSTAAASSLGDDLRSAPVLVAPSPTNDTARPSHFFARRRYARFREPGELAPWRRGALDKSGDELRTHRLVAADYMADVEDPREMLLRRASNQDLNRSTRQRFNLGRGPTEYQDFRLPSGDLIAYFGRAEGEGVGVHSRYEQPSEFDPQPSHGNGYHDHLIGDTYLTPDEFRAFASHPAVPEADSKAMHEWADRLFGPRKEQRRRYARIEDIGRSHADLHRYLWDHLNDPSTGLVYADALQDAGLDAHAEMVRRHVKGWGRPQEGAGRKATEFVLGALGRRHPSTAHMGINIGDGRHFVTLAMQAHHITPGRAGFKWSAGGLSGGEAMDILDRLEKEGSVLTEFAKTHLDQFRQDHPERMSRRRYAHDPDSASLSSSLRALSSRNQEVLRALAADILSDAGLTPHRIHDAIHDSTLGSRPTLLHTIDSKDDRDRARYAAAWYGLKSGEPALLVFHAHDDGPDSLYSMHLTGSAEDIAARLDQYQIPQRTLVPTDKGFRVFVHDKARSLRPNVARFAEDHDAEVYESAGTGERLGERAGADSRAAYRSVIRAYESGGDAGTGAATPTTQTGPVQAGRGRAADVRFAARHHRRGRRLRYAAGDTPDPFVWRVEDGGGISEEFPFAEFAAAHARTRELRVGGNHATLLTAYFPDGSRRRPGHYWFQRPVRSRVPGGRVWENLHENPSPRSKRVWQAGTPEAAEALHRAEFLRNWKHLMTPGQTNDDSFQKMEPVMSLGHAKEVEQFADKAIEDFSLNPLRVATDWLQDRGYDSHAEFLRGRIAQHDRLHGPARYARSSVGEAWNAEFRQKAAELDSRVRSSPQWSALTPEQQEAHAKSIADFSNLDHYGHLVAGARGDHELAHDAASFMLYGGKSARDPGFFAGYKPAEANLVARFRSYAKYQPGKTVLRPESVGYAGEEFDPSEHMAERVVAPAAAPKPAAGESHARAVAAISRLAERRGPSGFRVEDAHSLTNRFPGMTYAKVKAIVRSMADAGGLKSLLTPSKKGPQAEHFYLPEHYPAPAERPRSREELYKQVADLVAAGKKYNEIAEVTGAPITHVKRIVERYIPPDVKRSRTKKLKAKIVEMAGRGLGPMEVAKELGMHHTTVMHHYPQDLAEQRRAGKQKEYESREQKVAELLAQGKKHADIVRETGMGGASVSRYIKLVKQKQEESSAGEPVRESRERSPADSGAIYDGLYYPGGRYLPRPHTGIMLTGKVHPVVHAIARELAALGKLPLEVAEAILGAAQSRRPRNYTQA